MKRLLHIGGIILLSFLTLIVFAATLIPLIPSREWYVQVFDYPRLQTFLIAVICLAWYLARYFKRGRKGYIAIFMLVIVVLVQAYKAVPYTPFSKKQVLDADGDTSKRSSVSLLICNVLQHNKEYEKVLEKIYRYDPDMIITTETDITWEKQLEVLHKKYPNRVPVPQSNLYGMHLYSKYPLSQTEVRYLIEPDIPSIKTRVQMNSGDWINLIVLHPRPPVPGESSDSRERDSEIILVAKEVKKLGEAVIVAGDFNDVAWSENTELFQETSGLLDPRRGRGFYNTFHAKYPVFRWPLDHIFHSNHFKLMQMERLGKVNSDHFPMFVKLSFEPSEKHEQPEVQKENDTDKEAAEAIKAGINDKDAPGK
ncbi:MAG: endonuclease/exonuclease/phosphatase family protein [Flavitalea sp.]